MSLLKCVLISFVLTLAFVAPYGYSESSAVEQSESQKVQSERSGSKYSDLAAAPNWILQQGQKTISSNMFEGKPYVLHFWATWCPYCKRLQPGLEKVAVNFEEQNINTFAISFWENPNANPAREMLNRGLNLSVLPNGDDVAKAFGVQGTPTTVFINHRGEILARLTTSNPNDPQLRMAYKVLQDEYTSANQVVSKNIK